MPAGTETICIPGAFLLSATHNLYLSILLTVSLSLVHTLQAQFYLHFLSLPPSLPPPLSLFVLPHGYLAYCFLSSSLCYPSQPLSMLPPPDISQSQSLYIFILSSACIPQCLLLGSIIAYERIPCILVCFSGLLPATLFLLACHSRLHVETNTQTQCIFINIACICTEYQDSFLSITTDQQ